MTRTTTATRICLTQGILGLVSVVAFRQDLRPLSAIVALGISLVLIAVHVLDLDDRVGRRAAVAACLASVSMWSLSAVSSLLGANLIWDRSEVGADLMPFIVLPVSATAIFLAVWALVELRTSPARPKEAAAVASPPAS